jgi:hypothetical protein
MRFQHDNPIAICVTGVGKTMEITVIDVFTLGKKNINKGIKCPIGAP